LKLVDIYGNCYAAKENPQMSNINGCDPKCQQTLPFDRILNFQKYFLKTPQIDAVQFKKNKEIRMDSIFDFVIGTINNDLSERLEATILDICAAQMDNLIILKDDDHKLSIQGSLKNLMELESKLNVLDNQENLYPYDDPVKTRVISSSEASHIFPQKTPSRRDSKLPDLKCDLCSFKTKRPNHLVKHRQKHSDFQMVVKCAQCDFSCLRSADLAKHERNCHSFKSLSTLFSCDLCFFGAKNEKHLQDHKATKHILPDKVDLLKCSKCPYKTIKARFMIRHQKKHDPAVKSSTKSGTAAAVKKAKIMSCDLCYYKTSKVSNLYRHGLIHSGERKHLCIICGLGFKRSDTLKQHLAVHEGGQQGGVNLPSCDVCGKVCRSSTLLNEHRSSHYHHGSKDFLCDLCGMAFRTKATQLRHTKTVHNNSQTKSHKCQLCEQLFSSNHTLARHVKSFHPVLDEEEDEEEEEEPVIYTLDLTGTEETTTEIEPNLHAYLINESGSLINVSQAISSSNTVNNDLNQHLEFVQESTT
jgi:KRAB domain-containing zinc finger protein